MAEKYPYKRTGYSSYIDKYPSMKTTKRIKMPPIPKRPFRFQTRSLIRGEGIRGSDAWWLVIHRRGISRKVIGQNALEARAVPYGVIKGFLTERILYATLVNLFHFVPGVDFLYQSSQDGGRLEMGGMVADFLFPILRLIINPMGPQHYEFRNIKKDEEQVAILAERGYQVYLIDEEVIYDEYKLEEFLRRVFGGMSSGGGDSGGHPAQLSTDTEQENIQLQTILWAANALQIELHEAFGVQ